ncbi:hypothetical protein AMELA_G00243040 [Ameiurus melas]|uniref:Uncharacterized protein n=1 Tax=Ameiurus melas TaxID=219545 RepID=A0A7J5ZYL9_AMEME|nr:hypothetical protein AMELA_G00243040 [Ameiurus melas]
MERRVPGGRSQVLLRTQRQSGEPHITWAYNRAHYSAAAVSGDEPGVECSSSCRRTAQRITIWWNLSTAGSTEPGLTAAPPVDKVSSSSQCGVFRAGVGVVDEELCDQNTRPEDRHRHCKNMDCPARTVAGEERVLHPGTAGNSPNPKQALTCNLACDLWTTRAVGELERGETQGCSLTCGGGVKSRSVKCVIEPQIRCDPVTRPRSTTFCNLQSCSRTRPQPPTLTPSHDPNDLTSNPTPTPYTPTVSASHTPTPSVLHKDDQEFILVTNNSVVDDTHTGQNQDQDQEEEGSTDLQQPPDGSPYTPGYDYIMEDGREDVFTLHTPFSTSCEVECTEAVIRCVSGGSAEEVKNLAVSANDEPRVYAASR